MATVMIRHRVTDYARWKDVFDGFVEQRRAGGEKAYRIMQITGDANNLMLIFEWDSSGNAQRFMESPDLAAAMQHAGVSEPPEVWITEDLASGNT
jgi:hypothetical protein